MNRAVLTVASLTLILYITYAGVVEEFSFKSLGYKNVYINDVAGCANYSLSRASDVNGDAFHILSLRADFSGKAGEIRVNIGDGNEIAMVRGSEFENGVARIDVPHSAIADSRQLSVCARTKDDGNILIGSDSTFGTYTGAYFPTGEGLILELETYSPVEGVPFRADAVAKNYGTDDASVRLSYRKSELEENTPEVSILSGETTKQGTVPACRNRDENGFCTEPGEFRISYTMVANKAVPFTLLPAVMTYTNVFGEEARMLSNRPNLGSLEAPHKISVKHTAETDSLIVGTKTRLGFLMQNVSKGKVENIILRPVTGLEILEAEQTTITLEPGEKTELFFNARAPASGTYLVGCEAKYGSRTARCETTLVRAEEPLGGNALGSIALALVALGVFAWLYFGR